ncbi:MAG: transposase, partial [Anaerolactibacter massiliensis]|nr:transposase [Anaerolactibacter massiliensis]
QAGISQQILRTCDHVFRSFFALLSKKNSGGYEKEVRIPHYRTKGGKYLLVLSANAISIKNGNLIVPMSRAFSKQHPDLDSIRIPVPDRISGKHIAEVRIVPVLNGKALKIQYCYEQEEEPQNLNADNVLAIDVGLDNLASCVTTTGTSFIVDGRKLKSMNQWYNKQLAHYASIKDHQNVKGFTARMSFITDKRNRRVTDYMHKAARHIVDYCIANDIGTLIVGHNVDQKQAVNMGKANNQKFVQITFNQLRMYLNTLCERYGIAYIETEESYTSKASFFDGDAISVYDTKHPYAGTFSGKRIKRGLYSTKENTLVNADINGACNIAKEGKRNLSTEGLCSGLLASPLRIRIA